MSSTLVYALYEALSIVEEEGLDARWATARAQPPRAARVAAPASASRCCRREGERLWTLNAVRVPDGVDEAAVRMHLLEAFNIEIGAGSRSARRQDLARRPDGRELVAAPDRPPARRARERAGQTRARPGARLDPACDSERSAACWWRCRRLSSRCSSTPTSRCPTSGRSKTANPTTTAFMELRDRRSARQRQDSRAACSAG